MKPTLITQSVHANCHLMISGLPFQICGKTDLWIRTLAGVNQHDSADLIHTHQSKS